MQHAQSDAYAEHPLASHGEGVAHVDNSSDAAYTAEAGADAEWQQVLDEQSGHVVWRNTTTGELKWV